MTKGRSPKREALLGKNRRMHKLYAKTGRLDEWKTLLMGRRAQHKAKRRLMEVSDALEDNRKLIG